MITRILVALDRSPRAAAVLAAANELGDRFHAHLYLLRAVVVPSELPTAASEGDLVPEMLFRTAIEDLKALSARTPRALVHPPIVEIGQPWRAILATAERLDVDLVVLGSHGHPGAERVLGTTATKVANHAYRNVFIVHHDEVDSP